MNRLAVVLLSAALTGCALVSPKLASAEKRVASFFQMLSEKTGDLPRLLVYLSSHPSNQERIAHINSFIAQGGFKGSQLAPERLEAIKREIGPRPTAQAGPAASP